MAPKPKPWDELLAALRPLSSFEREGLRKSLDQFGYLGSPIYVMPDGRIIDGYHRYELIGDDAPVEVLEVDEATGFALGIAHNRDRRNLTPEQLKDLRERQKKTYLDLRDAGSTQDEAAEVVGISQQTGSDWENISNTKVGKAYIDQRLSIPKEARAQILERVEAGEPQMRIAADWGTTQPRISQIVTQERARSEAKAHQDEIGKQKAKDMGLLKPAEVLVIDPPWPMEKIERELRPKQGKVDYPLMTLDEINRFGKRLPCAANCHVWLWTTQRFLPAALNMLPGWDLHYVCTFIWHKPGGFQPVGLPQYNAEFAIYARHGIPQFTSTKNLKLCFEAPRSKHSEKPDEFYEMVKRVTDPERIDMFARKNHQGFDTWGKEAPL